MGPAAADLAKVFDGNKLGKRGGFFLFVYVNGMENVWEILYKSKEHRPISGPDRRVAEFESMMK